MVRYECSVCGYVYDEDQEGLPWEAPPDDWVCPTCGAGKGVFATAAAVPVAPEARSRSDAEGGPLARSTAVEPTLKFIYSLAWNGLDKTGHHGPTGAMDPARNVIIFTNYVSAKGGKPHVHRRQSPSRIRR